MTADTRNPQKSLLHNHNDRSLLVKILAEMRVQTLLMAEAFGSTNDVAALRDEVMSQANNSLTDV